MHRKKNETYTHTSFQWPVFLSIFFCFNVENTLENIWCNYNIYLICKHERNEVTWKKEWNEVKNKWNDDRKKTVECSYVFGFVMKTAVCPCARTKTHSSHSIIQSQRYQERTSAKRKWTWTHRISDNFIGDTEIISSLFRSLWRFYVNFLKHGSICLYIFRAITSKYSNLCSYSLHSFNWD